MKGEGLGTFLPAVQANTPTAMSQIATVLVILHSLFRLIMPKCLSKFEQEITDFHSEFNNVFTFGGLEPGGVSAQMNVSALGKLLSFFIGRVQGGWHTDVSDNICRWTLFVLLLRVSPGISCFIFLCCNIFETVIQMVIQDLSVSHAVVYTFVRKTSGLFFWYSKVQTFILDSLLRKIRRHISVGWRIIFLQPGMLQDPKTESDTLATLGVYHLIA